MKLTKKNRSKVYDFMYSVGTFSMQELKTESFRRAGSYEFDNSIGRFVRRFAEKGFAKRNKNGDYRVNARGFKFIEKNLYV